MSGQGERNDAGTDVAAVAAVEFEAMLLGRQLSLISNGQDLPHGRLDRSAYTLLSRIREEPMSIGELSQATRLDASTLNRQTAAMRAAGLVERIPDPDGGVARKFRITDEGIRRVEAQRGVNVRALARLFSTWRDDEVVAFATGLARFNRGIEELNGTSWRP